jgi:hypothetical protein
MSLLDKASLIVTPNAYKESKLYSVVPSSGAGDMNVVRATTATRVNSLGLIEVVPRNLALYSEDFTNVIWPKLECSITSNSTNSPTGTLTADSLIENSANGRHMIYRSFASVVGTTYTLSLFCKQGTRRYININFKTSTTASPRFSALFDLQTGTNVSTSSVGSPTGTSFGIVSLSDGWYRINISMNSTTTSTEYEIAPSNSATPTLSEGTPTYLGNGTGSVFIWGAQLEEGTTATEYFPTTTRLNIPRIDYTNGSCPSLLVEPQRTNLYFPSIPSNGANGTYTLNDAISPDGTQNASSFVPSGNGLVYSNAIITTVQTYTFSVYLKGTVNGQKVGLGDNVNILNNFTITTSWQRYTFTFTGSIQVTPFYLLSGNYFSPAENNKFYIYGAQLEVGSYATSLIPTQASSVTRNADVISKTGISSLIGQTEGTVFVDINVDLSYTQTDMRFINVSDGTSTNWWFIGTNVSNQIRFYYKTGATTYVSQLITLTSGRHKLAFAYKSNDYVAYVDGTQVHSLTSLIVGATSQVDLGNNFAGSGVSKQFINSAQLYKTRLTNAEIASLTTL